jgi:hypothetical protein
MFFHQKYCIMRAWTLTLLGVCADGDGILKPGHVLPGAPEYDYLRRGTVELIICECRA